MTATLQMDCLNKTEHEHTHKQHLQMRTEEKFQMRGGGMKGVSGKEWYWNDIGWKGSNRKKRWTTLIQLRLYESL